MNKIMMKLKKHKILLLFALIIVLHRQRLPQIAYDLKANAHLSIGI